MHVLVNFRIRDVYHPSPQSLLQTQFGDNLLQGHVVEYVSRAATKSDPIGEEFAVVEVAGMQEFVLVPRRLAHEVEGYAPFR